MNRRELIASTAAISVVAASPALARQTTGASMSKPTPPVAKKVPVRIEQVEPARIGCYRQCFRDLNG